MHIYHTSCILQIYVRSFVSNVTSYNKLWKFKLQTAKTYVEDFIGRQTYFQIYIVLVILWTSLQLNSNSNQSGGKQSNT